MGGNSLSYVDPKAQYAVIVPIVLGAATNALNVYSSGGNSKEIWMGAAIGAVGGAILGLPTVFNLSLGYYKGFLFYGGVSMGLGWLNRGLGLNTQNHENFYYDSAINFATGGLAGSVCAQVGRSVVYGNAGIFNNSPKIVEMVETFGGELGALNGSIWLNNNVNYSNYFRGLSK